MYTGTERRMYEGETSPVHRTFPETRNDLLQLRAHQIAIEIAERRRLAAEPLSGVDGALVDNTNWGALVKAMSDRFRADDEALPLESPFRAAIIRECAEIMGTEAVVREPELQGNPRTAKEAELFDRIILAIEIKLRELRNKATDNTPIKERAAEGLNKFMIAVTNKVFRGFKKLDPDKQQKVLESTAATFKFLATYGLKELLAQLKHEAEAKLQAEEKGGTLTTTLDNPFIEKQLRRLTAKFIAGGDLEEALDNERLNALTEQGLEVSYAREIEATFDSEIGDKNFRETKESIRQLREQPDKNKKFVSVKLSGFALYDEDFNEKGELSKPRKQEVKEYVLALLQEATESHDSEDHVYICIDMEYFLHKDVTFEIFTEIIRDYPQYRKNLGMVIQAYLKESKQDAKALYNWCIKNGIDTSEVNLRLVKGANKIADEAHAQAGLHKDLNLRWDGEAREDWVNGHRESPIAENIQTTQSQFIEIMHFFENIGINVRYGTHNINSVAHVIATWMNLGEIPAERQIQSLNGMYDDLKKGLQNVVNQRVYAPYGKLGLILEYMYRRFLELQKTEGMNMMEYKPGSTELAEARPGCLTILHSLQSLSLEEREPLFHPGT